MESVPGFAIELLEAITTAMARPHIQPLGMSIPSANYSGEEIGIRSIKQELEKKESSFQLFEEHGTRSIRRRKSRRTVRRAVMRIKRGTAGDVLMPLPLYEWLWTSGDELGRGRMFCEVLVVKSLRHVCDGLGEGRRC